MKKQLKINIFSVSIGLFFIGLSLFMYEGIRSNITGYFAYQQSDLTPYIQVSLPKPEPSEIPNSLINISAVSFAQLKFFDKNDYQNPVFVQEGIKYEIVYNGNKISHLQISPDQQKIGFYEFFPDETGYERVALVIMNIDTKNFKEIKDKNDNFSNWEWRDTETVSIGINCGSSCHYTQVTSIDNGQIIAQYFKGQKFQF